MSLINLNLTITKSYIISYIKIEIANLILFESCSFNVSLYDEGKNIIDMNFFIIQGEEYKLWKEDDEYIINWIKNKLNIT